MTDKRFRLDTGCFIDMQENKVLTEKQANNMLNKLNDENQNIKHENQELRLTITKIEREFKERRILTEEEFLEIIQ